MVQASFGYFGIAKETTAGTAVAPTTFVPVKEVDFPVTVEWIEFKEIALSREAYNVLDGPVRPEASMKQTFYGEGVTAMLLKGLVGAVASSTLVSPSTTVYEHTFADAAVLQSFTLERSDAAQGGGGIFNERLAGAKVERLALTAAFGEDVGLEWGFQALHFPTNETPATSASITYPSTSPFVFTGASVKMDSVANNFVKSLNAEFRNMLTRQEALRGVRESYSLAEGGIECTLSGTLIFEDLSFYNKFKNFSTAVIDAQFDGDTIDAPNSLKQQFTINWPIVKVGKFGVPFRAGEVVEADVEFKVIYDRTNKRSFQMKLRNLEDGTTY
jgi:hypothetical protein